MKQILNIFGLFLLLLSTCFYLNGLYDFFYNNDHFFNENYYWSFLLSVVSTSILFNTKFIPNFLKTKKFNLKE